MGCRNDPTRYRMGSQARSRHLGHLQFIANSISQRTWVLLQSTNDVAAYSTLVRGPVEVIGGAATACQWRPVAPGLP
jgi:hypothetical protein